MKTIDRIEQLIRNLNEDFPTAEFSFGYLMDLPCPKEKQRYYVFTQVPGPKSSFGSAQRFNWVCKGMGSRFRYACRGAGDMEEILEDLNTGGFLGFMENLSGHIDSPEHKDWHYLIHANDCPQCGGKPCGTGVRRANERAREGSFVRYDGIRYQKINHCINCNVKYPLVGDE